MRGGRPGAGPGVVRQRELHVHLRRLQGLSQCRRHRSARRGGREGEGGGASFIVPRVPQALSSPSRTWRPPPLVEDMRGAAFSAELLLSKASLARLALRAPPDGTAARSLEAAALSPSGRSPDFICVEALADAAAEPLRGTIGNCRAPNPSSNEKDRGLPTFPRPRLLPAPLSASDSPTASPPRNDVTEAVGARVPAICNGGGQQLPLQWWRHNGRNLQASPLTSRTRRNRAPLPPPLPRKKRTGERMPVDLAFSHPTCDLQSTLHLPPPPDLRATRSLPCFSRWHLQAIHCLFLPSAEPRAVTRRSWTG